jgi:hypothetical protein
MNSTPSGCGGKGPAGRLDGTTRVVYFDGQRLQADDLNSAADQMRQLRWLHNRSLHNWGIGLGFDAAGNTGDRQVTVQPGYAIDCLGRELVLTEPASLAVPARSGNAQGQPVPFALVAAYPDDSELAVIQTRAADCGGTAGAVRLRERAAVYWREPPINTGLEILLATASVQNCQLAQPLAVDKTRRARGIATPFVATGQTDQGETAWEPWLETVAQDETFLVGIKAQVDTSGAQFSATPIYQAQLRGARFFDLTVGDTRPPFLLDGTVIVGDAAPGSFTTYVHLPRMLRDPFERLNPPTLFETGSNGQDALLALVNEEWTIAWIGVED